MKTESKKLFSASVISGTAFVGGPIAAGYMIRSNYRSQNKKIAGAISLLVGFLLTLIFLYWSFSQHHSILDKIPKVLLPFINSAIIWLIVQQLQGIMLHKHREENLPFYNLFSVISIGIVSAIISVILLFVALFTFPKNNQFSDLQYLYTKNETSSLTFYDAYFDSTEVVQLEILRSKSIPLSIQNIKISQKIEALESNTQDMQTHAFKMKKYSELRLQSFNLYYKAIKEESSEYEAQLDVIHAKIDAIIESQE